MRGFRSLWVAALISVFTMPVLAQFPIVVDFENAGSIPAGWTNDAGDSGENWLFQIPSGTSSNPCSYGATVDHTTDPGSYVAWVDDSSPNTTPTNLISPAYDVTGLTAPGVSFYYWIGRGGSLPISNLVVDVYDGTMWHSDVLTVGASNGWSLGYVDLAPYVSAATQIQFRAMEGTSFYYDICLDDITIGDFAAPPGCTSPLSPADMATAVAAPDGSLNWSAAAGATGYYLFFGTDGGGVTSPSNIVYGVDVGDVTSYAYTGIAYSTTHYWQVVPFNSYGIASGCDIWEFMTGDDPNYGGGAAAQGGYYYANSNASYVLPPWTYPTCGWIDISGTGTDVLAGFTDDNVIGPYPIGFTFTFFGVDYTQFWMSSNGWITFTTTAASELTNTNIPSTSGSENIIAWFWDDMDPPEALVLDRHCYYGTTDVDGDGDDDMVVSFVHYPKYRSGGSLAGDWLTAQAVLYNDAPAGNDRIRLHYEDYGPDIILNSATVGIENAAGTEGVEYHYNGTKGPIFNAQPDVALCLVLGPDNSNVPVELASFSGVGGAGYVELRWETATEHENLGYYVLRKAPGGEAFARVNQELVPGAGTTLEPRAYGYRDEGLAMGTYQYTLVDVSFEGATAEHGPITVAVGEGLPVAYAIQAKSGDPVEFRLSLPAQTQVNLTVYDMAGREVWTMGRDRMEAGVYTVAWPGLTAGGNRASSSTYVYRVRCGEAFVQTGKVVLLR